MASSFTSRLRLEEQATGEGSTTWGSVLNAGALELIDDAVAGMATVAVTGGAYSLTTNNGSADEARMAVLKFTGVLASDSTITIPDKTKTYVVWNATSGAHTLTLKPSSTGVAVTQGSKAIVFCDGSVAYKIIETGGTPATTGSNSFTGDQTGADNKLIQWQVKDVGYTQKAHGNIGTGTEDFAFSDGNYHTVTCTGAFAITTSAWPPTTNLGWMTLKITNGGSATITWPTINWVKPDGSTTTNFATYLAAAGYTGLQNTGVNFVVLWSDDAGTTIYGKLV